MEFIADDKSTSAKFDDFNYVSESSRSQVTYLTHSWVQCQPIVASERAVDIAATSNVLTHNMNKTTPNASCSTKKRPAEDDLCSPSRGIPKDSGSRINEEGRNNVISTIGQSVQGVLNAFRGLHMAAVRLMSKSNSDTADAKRASIGGEVDDASEEIHRIPCVDKKISSSTDAASSSPIDSLSSSSTKFSSNPSSSSSSNLLFIHNPDVVTSLPDVSASSPENCEVYISAHHGDQQQTNASATRSPSGGAGWILPDSLFRISFYLAKERENILLRLMGTISVHSINHENICCLNTALVIFILAHERGQLATLLENARILFYHQNIPAPALEGIMSEFPDDEIACFVNFRKLLWYWREYYLRRGRDRLSLEFSSHLHFKKWNTVVDLLCSDDGSPTALLRKPIKFPVSPYAHVARASNSTSAFIQNSRPVFVRSDLSIVD